MSETHSSVSGNRLRDDSSDESSKSNSRPDWVSKPLTSEEIQQCVDGGCSGDFERVLRTDTPDGISRHSTRLEVKKQLREWGEDPQDMTRLAGDFFTALWNGNRERYVGHADSNNRQILHTAGLI